MSSLYVFIQFRINNDSKTPFFGCKIYKDRGICMEYREIPEGYNDEKVQEFLSELSALAKKYGIAIHGCGCCGSPIIYGLINSPYLPHGFGYEKLKIDKDTLRYKVGEKSSVWI